ncbi:hypothetical protein HXX76_006680 [Chlamydomonas incerta]|uniref:Transmembrane protein 184C n=1 Tax=Chlamydomonas incerta TaxID=51695 RepID=A0A835T033_CHLIN|nr:hypothetical protein HXX76_006680 [Chlamydomonas incerta]|eukprot:KAG2436373.1 hypothetical protein HXX76_006680 [Chlamydomonas incerta]
MRRWFRLLWWCLCLLTFIALPLTIWEFQKQHYDVHYQAWFIGGIFVILSMPISIYEIAMHTEYYTQPRLQKHVIRILLMVPIYAVDAWFALRFRRAREYLDPIRECYEAFVIYSFFAYLMAYLQDTLGDVNEHLAKKPQMQHLWGVRWLLRPWDMGTQFLWECKKGVLNYVILRPICTSLAFITDIFDEYGEGQINFRKSYVYLAAVTNFSQLWALYCLVMLYTAMHQELAPIRPLSKFLCIKAVVFVTFWQSIAIAILVYAGVLRKESWTTYDKVNVATGIQDFLICIEMFLAALAHAYAFPPRDYMAGHSKGFFSNVRYIFDLRDVVDDVGAVVEDHVSSATSAVVKVPQRAVKKAAQGIAKNTKKLFGAASGNGRSGRGLLDEEDEAAAKCALLGPAAGTPGSSGGPGSGAAPGSSAGSSAAGCGGGRYMAGLGSAGSSPGDHVNEREMLTAPQQHLMMHEFDTSPLHQLPSAGLAHTSGGSGGGGRFGGALPPLPPTSATLGGAAGGAAAAGAAGSAAASSASGISTLLTSALYHGHKRTGSGGSGDLTLRGRRGSGASDYGPAYQGLAAMGHSALPHGPGAGGAGGGAGSGGGGGPGGSGAESYCAEYEDVAGPSGGGVEVPLVAVSHHHHLHSAGGSGGAGAGGGGGLDPAGRRGSAGALASLGGSGGGVGGGGAGGSVSGGSVWAKLKGGERSGRGAGRGGAGAAGGGGNSSGDDAPYERLPMLPVSSKRAHGE